MSPRTMPVKDRLPLLTAARIALASDPALATRSTALTTLLFAPLLSVALLVGVAASLGAPDVRTTAYAAALLTFGLTMISSLTSQVARDRMTGALSSAGPDAWTYPWYWASKIITGTLAGVALAVMTVGAIWLTDPAHAAGPALMTLSLLPGIWGVGVICGIALAAASLALNDPYALPGLVATVLTLLTGTIAPLAAYPEWLAVVCRTLPFTALVEYARTSDPTAVSLGVALGIEMLVSAVWGGIGLGVAAWALQRTRQRPQPGL